MVGTSPWGCGRNPPSHGLGRGAGRHGCSGAGRVEINSRRLGKTVHLTESTWVTARGGASSARA
eukprot:8728961-Prorocentrum_lima.AAC.1